jgi:hypothetical protein
MVDEVLELTIGELVMEPACGFPYTYETVKVYANGFNLTNFNDYFNFDQNQLSIDFTSAVDQTKESISGQTLYVEY